MAASNPDIQVTGWTDVVSIYPAMVSAGSFVQNKGPAQLLVFFSASSSAPTDNSGFLLANPGDYVTGTAAHVWVKAYPGGNAIVQAGNTDATATAPVVTVPAAPTISVTAGAAQATIAWTDGATGGAAITSHKLYRGTTAGAEVLVGTISSGSPYIDSGLTNGTTYFYKLSAVNSAGEGPLSTEQSATPIDVPAALASVTLTPGTGQISIAWVDGATGGSAITGHNLYRGTASGGEALIGLITSSSPYIDTGRLAGQTYYYRLSAVNAIGEGPLSAEQSAAPLGIPAANPMTSLSVPQGVQEIADSLGFGVSAGAVGGYAASPSKMLSLLITSSPLAMSANIKNTQTGGGTNVSTTASTNSPSAVNASMSGNDTNDFLVSLQYQQSSAPSQISDGRFFFVAGSPNAYATNLAVPAPLGAVNWVAQEISDYAAMKAIFDAAGANYCFSGPILEWGYGSGGNTIAAGAKVLHRSLRATFGANCIDEQTALVNWRRFEEPPTSGSFDDQCVQYRTIPLSYRGSLKGGTSDFPDGIDQQVAGRGGTGGTPTPLPSAIASAPAVATAGVGYSSAPTVTFAAPIGGTAATAHAVMSGTAPNMTVASIVLDTPGIGYAVATTPTLAGGTPTTAATLSPAPITTTYPVGGASFVDGDEWMQIGGSGNSSTVPFRWDAATSTWFGIELKHTGRIGNDRRSKYRRNHLNARFNSGAPHCSDFEARCNTNVTTGTVIGQIKWAGSPDSCMIYNADGSPVLYFTVDASGNITRTATAIPAGTAYIDFFATAFRGSYVSSRVPCRVCVTSPSSTMVPPKRTVGTGGINFAPGSGTGFWHGNSAYGAFAFKGKCTNLTANPYLAYVQTFVAGGTSPFVVQIFSSGSAKVSVVSTGGSSTFSIPNGTIVNGTDFTLEAYVDASAGTCTILVNGVSQTITTTGTLSGTIAWAGCACTFLSQGGSWEAPFYTGGTTRFEGDIYYVSLFDTQVTGGALAIHNACVDGSNNAISRTAYAAIGGATPCLDMYGLLGDWFWGNQINVNDARTISLSPNAKTRFT